MWNSRRCLQSERRAARIMVVFVTPPIYFWMSEQRVYDEERTGNGKRGTDGVWEEVRLVVILPNAWWDQPVVLLVHVGKRVVVVVDNCVVVFGRICSTLCLSLFAPLTLNWSCIDRLCEELFTFGNMQFHISNDDENKRVFFWGGVMCWKV